MALVVQYPPDCRLYKYAKTLGASGNKLMVKIAILWDNNSYITPPRGSPVRAQYSKGEGPRGWEL